MRHVGAPLRRSNSREKHRGQSPVGAAAWRQLGVTVTAAYEAARVVLALTAPPGTARADRSSFRASDVEETQKP